MKKLAILLACICTALSVPAADLVMDFKLNEGSGTVVKDTAGSITGNVIFPENTKWAAGREENTQALYFTGVDDKSRKGGSVILPRGKVDFSKPFTLMFYFFADKKLPRNSHKELVSCSLGEKGPGFRTMFSWNRICFWTGDGKKRSELNTNANKVKVARGVWHHVAFTMGDGKAEIYFNGIKVAEKSNMLPINKLPSVIEIGSYHRGYAYNYNGAISDVKVYNGILTDKEILAMVKGIE